MSSTLERKVGALERRAWPPPAPPARYVITVTAFKALSPREKADIFRGIVRGEIAYETGKDRKPARVASKAELERMTPEQRVAEYRRALQEALE